MQIIDAMTEEEREALDQLSGGAIWDSNGHVINVVQNAMTAYNSLFDKGYSREQILGLTESYDRIKNAENMSKAQKAGACFDCLSPTSICCQFLITRRSMHAGRMKVILVNDELGF